MSLSDQQIKRYLKCAESEAYPERALQKTIQTSRAAFYESEAEGSLSVLEFLYQQGRYIQKRWWFMQALLLLILWGMLSLMGDAWYVKRLMGTAASLFAVLILPELWKNRNADAVEIECAAYFSLRQVYAARILLFALVDLLLLGSFTVGAVASGRFAVWDMVIQFFLPYLITCCICFRCLYSKKAGAEIFAVFLCIVWSGVWTQIMLHEKVYAAISLPMWYALLAAAAGYLFYCIYRGQKNCRELWEVRLLWN